MEVPITWAAYGAICVLTIALLLMSNNLLRSRRKLNLPPGPKPWPIIGNLDLIGPLPFRSLHELSKKYGPMMILWYGSVPVVVGSSAEVARLFFKTHDEVFAGRPKLAAGEYTQHNYSGILWSQYGPYFKQVRKICLIELFSSKRLESYSYIKLEEMNCLIKTLYKLSLNENSANMRDHLVALSLNTITRMVLGKKYMDQGENSMLSVNEFKDLIDEFYFLNGVFNLGDWIPFFKYIDVQGYVKRMKVLGKKLDRFMEHVLDEHDERREGEKENWVPKDMVDVLLELSKDPNLDVKLERYAVKGISQDLIIGGTDSSAITLEWAMAELLKQPSIITKAMEELEQMVGKEKWVTEKDIQNLPYIGAIVKETLRLHSVAPSLAPHFSKEDVQVQGYHIPKGSVIILNIFSSHRDANIYENPEEFLPERFIENNLDVKGQHYEFLPFGSGRRMCPGYNHGLKVVELTLANMLHGFSWKLPDNMKPEDLDMEEKFGLTVTKNIPLIAYAEPRLAPHLYQAI